VRSGIDAPRKLSVVAYQTESSPNAIAGELPPALLTWVTALVAGSMRVTPGPGTQPPATQTARLSATISRQTPLSGMVATTVSLLGLMRTTALMFWTPTQIEPAPAAIEVGPASGSSPTGMRSTTCILAGSIFATEPVGSQLWFATQTKPSKTVIPNAPRRPELRLPTTRLVAGSIRVTRLPGALVSQIESVPTARIAAGSGNVITAVTASVVGSILATELLGPVETQIEPKPAVTS